MNSIAKTLCLLSIIIVVIGILRQPAPAQKFAPPATTKIDAKKLALINDKIRRLGAAVASLKRQGLGQPWLADLDVYFRSTAWIVEHQEFYRANFADWTLEALDRGLLRVKLAAAGDFPWLQQRGRGVVRGYYSSIDGSVQPYAVTFPREYGKNPKKKWRLDVVLHGRDKTLTEVKFLKRHDGEKETDLHYVQLDIYGRGNNAYRWAGESDVIEAVSAFLDMEGRLGRASLLDPRRIVLRGFSMGGAGAWHIGLHMPDRWCVVGPGAGFTTTHGYVGKLPAKLPWWQEKCLHIYDAVDYAENVANIPVVAYAGSQDKQLQAARNIQAKLKGLSFAKQMTLLIAPGLGHKFPPEWQQKAEAEYAKHVEKGKEPNPDHIRFVTYTLKYPRCHWLEILGLETHYNKAVVDARRDHTQFKITTDNVQSLHIALSDIPSPAVAIEIDKQKLSTKPVTQNQLDFHVYLRKTNGRWQAVLPQLLATERLRQYRKTNGLQGPIDDAFTSPFLCVQGTGKPWHEKTQQYAAANLKRFRHEWSKFWRGELPVKDDVDVTANDIAGKNLILFGDPSSNSLIAQVAGSLPLTWNAENIIVNGNKYASAKHVPLMIFPSPLNARRYVVLNSGHTFHTPDYLGTNALLFPRLGDYAVLRLTPTNDNPWSADVATAGLFDDNWQFGKTKNDTPVK